MEKSFVRLNLISLLIFYKEGGEKVKALSGSGKHSYITYLKLLRRYVSRNANISAN